MPPAESGFPRDGRGYPGPVQPRPNANGRQTSEPTPTRQNGRETRRPGSTPAACVDLGEIRYFSRTSREADSRPPAASFAQ